MRSYLAAFVFMFSFVSHAATRSISDLMYLPNQGVRFGKTDVGIITGSSEFNDGEAKYSGWVIQQEAGYSFLNNLFVSFHLRHEHIDTKYNFNDFDDSHSSSKGFGDPSLRARYRILESNFILDLVGISILSLGESEAEGNQSDALQGGHSFALGTELGQKLGSLEYFFFAGFTHNFESKSSIETDGDTITTKDDAYTKFRLGAEAQFLLQEKMYLETGLSAEFSPEYKDDRDEETSSSTTYVLKAQFNYVYSSVLMLNVGHTYTDLHTAGIQNLGYSTFYLGALYQF